MLECVEAAVTIMLVLFVTFAIGPVLSLELVIRAHLPQLFVE